MTVEQILARHDAGDYLIHHWTGFFKKSAVTGKQACRRIKAQMEEVIRAADAEGISVVGLQLMSAEANRFIADLWELPALEFEKLRQLDDEELMNRAPYTPGPMAPWLAKEGRSLRFGK